MLSELYGRDKYQSHIKVGDEYWYFFTGNSEVYKTTGEHWHKIKITYIRSGCLFYILPEHPEVKEDYCPICCFMTSRFILAELSPTKDLKELFTDIDTESAKYRYCFDDEFTVVKDWPNEKEIEVDEKDLFEKFGETSEYLLIKMLEEKET